MAQVDLKYAFIKIADGYSKTGTAGAAGSIGATTLTVTGMTGAVAVGDTFTVAGDTTEYTISAHTETLGNTSSITFSPGLVAAVTSGAAITVGPHNLIVKIGEGNLTYSEKRKIDYVLDRGRLDTVRQGDEQPVEVKLDFMWEFLRAATGDPPTVEDALKQRGNAANWISSSSDPCEPYCVDIIIDYIPPCGGIDSERIILADFRYEDLAHDQWSQQLVMAV